MFTAALYRGVPPPGTEPSGLPELCGVRYSPTQATYQIHRHTACADCVDQVAVGVASGLTRDRPEWVAVRQRLLWGDLINQGSIKLHNHKQSLGYMKNEECCRSSCGGSCQSSSFHPKQTEDRPKTTILLPSFGVFALVDVVLRRCSRRRLSRPPAPKRARPSRQYLLQPTQTPYM